MRRQSVCYIYYKLWDYEQTNKHNDCTLNGNKMETMNEENPSRIIINYDIHTHEQHNIQHVNIRILVVCI